MNFTVEVEDFYLEDGELTSELESHVKAGVVRQITANIKDKVETQITQKVNEMIEQKMSLVIDTVLTDLVGTGVIVRSGKEIAIEQHVKDLFTKNQGWGSVNTQMERITKKFGDELKAQYNNAFANKVVLNMKKQGLLKDEVVQILLGSDDER